MIPLEDSTQSDRPAAKALGKSADWAVAARALLENGQRETAIKLALKVWKEGSDPEATLLASEVLSSEVPRWHFRLVRDQLRNAAYDSALRRAIKPGMRVLDIGSGTGLLAMMAARAGAEQVFSCEMNLAVADAAREIIEANGFADRVSIIARHSDELDADRDLGGRVDLIVSEIVSNNMLSQGVLTTMGRAVTHLLKPGGQAIPARGTVKIALGFDPEAFRRRMDRADGFDLTAFNRLAEPRYTVSPANRQFQMMSETVDVFEFDFHAASHLAKGRAERVVTAREGLASCVAQWIHLQMDEVGSYENVPGKMEESAWAILAHTLPKQLSLHAGDLVKVVASHDLESIRIVAALDKP